MNGNLLKKNNLSSTKNSKGNDFTFIFVLIEKETVFFWCSFETCFFSSFRINLWIGDARESRKRIPEVWVAHVMQQAGTSEGKLHEIEDFLCLDATPSGFRCYQQ